MNPWCNSNDEKRKKVPETHTHVHPDIEKNALQSDFFSPCASESYYEGGSQE